MNTFLDNNLTTSKKRKDGSMVLWSIQNLINLGIAPHMVGGGAVGGAIL